MTSLKRRCEGIEETPRAILRVSGFCLGDLGVSLILALAISLAGVDEARALPSFAEQTNQPCAACHVGAFGPQLTSVARDFKLFGYSSTDGQDHFPPIAITVQTSITHTSADQPGGAAPHFGPNDNFAFDQASVYYAGRIMEGTGAFAELNYDGIGRRLLLNNVDVRHARDGTVFGDDLVYGVTINNSPTVQDLWNSTPAWGFPYDASGLAPVPANATLIDNTLGQQVAGVGIYAMWNDWVYAEIAGYKGLGRDVRNALGAVPVAGTDSIDGVAPYWRLAIQHGFDKDHHYFELGTYGISADIFPGGTKIAGTDGITDVAVDANYQYRIDPKRVVANFLSMHATYIREQQHLDASSQLAGTNPTDSLNTFRADASYSIAATYTPTVQYFQTSGTNDAARFGTANGSPNSNGWVLELGFVPWGKPDSPVNWANARLSLQYIAYTRFDGQIVGASRNNTLYLNLWLAMAVNR